MGYVNDTQSAMIIPPCDMMYSGGTWTDSVSSNQWSKNKTAAADTTTVRIPLLKLFQNAAALKGSLLKSIDLWYTVGTLAMTTVTATLYKLTAPADNTAPGAPSAPAFTYDSGHASNANRVAAQNHKMTLTLTSPLYLDDDDVYFIELALVAQATSVFSMKEARANFTLRL